MSQAIDWYQLHLEVDHPQGVVSAHLYAQQTDGQLSLCDATTFGPFDDAEDVTKWLVRKLATTLRLRLR